MYRCPICLKEYDSSSFIRCECGFEDYNAYDHEDETLFKIFKYTKNVFLNRIDYVPSSLEVLYKEDNMSYVDIISKPRGLEVVESSDSPTCAVNGICAFFKDTKALILNTHYAHSEFLDESSIRILFLGKDFKGFINTPKHIDKIKYLYVHKDNPYFKAENNKLMKK